jgi:hypothetical protein
VSLREHRAGDQGSVPLEQFGERLAGELYSAGLKPLKSSERHA